MVVVVVVVILSDGPDTAAIGVVDSVWRVDDGGEMTIVVGAVIGGCFWASVTSVETVTVDDEG